jgi:hypothetical protein
MSISIAHMSLELVKHQPLDNMSKRAVDRVNELETIRKIIQRKHLREHYNFIDFFFAFQFFLVGAFIALCYV